MKEDEKMFNDIHDMNFKKQLEITSEIYHAYESLYGTPYKNNKYLKIRRGVLFILFTNSLSENFVTKKQSDLMALFRNVYEYQNYYPLKREQTKKHVQCKKVKDYLNEHG